ncbi:conserved hypothetical protein [Desulfofarcimen acetoxidans DSM 771]|uniref:DUF2680 domain-containing protein n=1 Tax=Desulfofarcimen acetoxidans (strain ATCC 49208 / DSM 771 / KCTC 5769 / VKM B-1644 / 5575) TaxID=485916 RepID=C8VXG9_DESAS|nr:DUF2680 domain-containing protein [Desulfofarcimen acetoxidans]ACV64565.1 conserved hypothetical protein [Desulfofarcimen acetoxidans DSM 771]
MKRKWIIGVALLVLVSFAVPVFAATNTAIDAKTWFEQKFAAKKAAVDQAVKDGRITEEQGQVWKEHFDQMAEFHEQNGYICPGGGPGMGYGKGNGMMRGNGMGMWGGQTSVAPVPTN